MHSSKRILILFVFCLLTFILSGSPSSLLYSDVKCDGCRRTAFIENIDIDAEEIIHEDWIRSLLVEAVTTPCFRIQASKDDLFKPPEYLFWISYYKDEKEDIKSSLTISLHYNGTFEEHVKTWTTETENPRAKFPWHENSMFKNRRAELRKDHPLELTVLNDFEKRPYRCKIEVEKEMVVPGEEIEVRLTEICDIEGSQSREFNRIVVQAREGKIIGGESLAADSDLKAFKVGKGTIQFKYKAPQSCGKEQDTVFVHNSCDILREDLYPLSKTELGSKIAEQNISCVRSLIIDCVWSSPPLSSENNISYGGTAQVEICFKVGEPLVAGGQVRDLSGEGRGSQKCWVKANKPKWGIENKRCTEFNSSVAYGSCTGDRYGFVLKIDQGRLSYDIVEKQNGMDLRFPMEKLGVERILSGIIFEILEKPDAAFKESRKDQLGIHYEVTARWKK